MPVEKLDAEPVTVEILAVLRNLAARSHSPLVRTCLESTAEDIAYLTDTGESPEE